MQFVKNIIFDLGGVIINLDVSATERAFLDLFGEKAVDLKTTHAAAQIFHPFETGAISDVEFRQRIKAVTGKKVPDKEIDLAWNAMLGDIPKDRLELLEQLKNKYRTFLLSNTNTIHYKAFNKILQNAHQQEGLSPYFENCYYSQEVGLRKPHPDIFDHVLTRNRLQPEETLFLDDTLMHLEGASQLGIHTEHVQNERDIFSILRNF